MVELRGMMAENMPSRRWGPAAPDTSTPRVKGQTSVIMIPVCAEMAPVLSPAWMAAPRAMASSGSTPRFGSLPKKSATRARIPAAPATSRPPAPPRRSAACRRARRRAPTRWGPAWSATSGPMSRSTSARVTSISSERGAPSFTARKGSVTWVLSAAESSILACSAAALRRVSAVRSRETSTPSCFSKRSRSQPASARSKSPPPRRLLPAEALTSSTPLNISSTETSKVPPPRS